MTADIRTRDRQDSERNYGATHGDDAVILDTTDMTIAQQVNQIVGIIQSQSILGQLDRESSQRHDKNGIDSGRNREE